MVPESLYTLSVRAFFVNTKLLGPLRTSPPPSTAPLRSSAPRAASARASRRPPRAPCCEGGGVIKVQTQLLLLKFNTFTTFKGSGKWVPCGQFRRGKKRLKALNETNPTITTRNRCRASTRPKVQYVESLHELSRQIQHSVNF